MKKFTSVVIHDDGTKEKSDVFGSIVILFSCIVSVALLILAVLAFVG